MPVDESTANEKFILAIFALFVVIDVIAFYVIELVM